jgi:hypothetical protein
VNLAVWIFKFFGSLRLAFFLLVNFVSVAGFHTYGFGGGGLPYVSGAVLLDLIFVSFLAFRYNKIKSRRPATLEESVRV